MTSTYKALESVRSSLTRSRQLLEFPVRRFWAVWASRQLLDRITRLLEEGKEEFGFRNLPLCNAARTVRLDKRNVRNTNEDQDVPQIWDLVVIRSQWGSGIDANRRTRNQFTLFRARSLCLPGFWLSKPRPLS
jgi:hypothetical protein